MAPGMDSRWAYTSAQNKAIDLPEKFQCRNCSKFKPPSLFSNKELNTGYRRKVIAKIRVNGITAKLRCRNCAGDQVQELQCVGPCDLWKGLDDFSKNQRRHPDDAWCLTCTQWKEANEPGVTPAAAPNYPLAPDEENALADEETGAALYSVAVDNIEGEADSDNDSQYRYSYSNAGDSITGTAGKAEGSTSSTARGPLVELASDSLLDVGVARSESSISNPYDVRTEHDGDSTAFGTDALSAEISVIEGRGKPEWSVADRKRRVPTQSFNVWDPSGQMHRRTPTAPSTADTVTSTGFQNTQMPGEIRTGRGGFAKAVGRSIQPTQFPPFTRPILQNNARDDDEERDEM